MPTVLVEIFTDSRNRGLGIGLLGPRSKVTMSMKSKENIVSVVAGLFNITQSEVRVIVANAFLENENDFFLKISATADVKKNVYADQLADHIREVLPSASRSSKFEVLLFGVDSTRTHAVKK